MNLASLRGKLLIGLALGLVVMVVLGMYADLPSLAGAFGRFDWRWLPAILGLTLANYALRFLKWQFLLRVLGVPPLPTRQSFLIFFSGLSMVVTPGKVGEWLKSVLLRDATGMPISASAPIVLAERLSDGLAMALLASTGLILYGYGWQLLGAAFLIGVVIVGVSQYRPLALKLLSLAGRLPVVGGKLHLLENFYESSRQVFRWQVLLLSIGIGLVSWSAEGVAFFLVLVALGIAPTLVLAVQAVFILSVATIAGAVSMLPGGLAAAEGSLTGLLLVLGVTADPAVAAAATLIIRFATLWFGVSLGIIALSVLARKVAPVSEAGSGGAVGHEPAASPLSRESEK